MIVVDTHALFWWVREPGRLSARAKREIDTAHAVGVPSIVFWEIALLARRRRIDLGSDVRGWVREILSIPRIEPLPLTPDIAVRADELSLHPDPADRFIVATALEHHRPLVTRDRLIIDAGVVRAIW